MSERNSHVGWFPNNDNLPNVCATLSHNPITRPYHTTLSQARVGDEHRGVGERVPRIDLPRRRRRRCALLVLDGASARGDVRLSSGAAVCYSPAVCIFSNKFKTNLYNSTNSTNNLKKKIH